MIGVKCFAVVAAALLAAVDAGQLPSGVCYSPWHHGSVNADIIGKDMTQMKQFFSSIRTFHASFGGVNVIDSAAAAGIKVAVGIQMGDRNGIAGEITAACEGAKRHPGSVSAIFVGNENLKNNDFGTFSAGELVGYINQIKGCTSGLNIKVGSVQRINEWLDAAGAGELAAACDTIGVNIYPFFSQGSQSPIEKLKAQWALMAAKYAEDKLTLTETGWPRAGDPAFGNTPSQATQQQFLNDFAEWSKSHSNAYFFMMYDTTVSYSGANYEKHFGLADTSGALQVAIPSGDGAAADNTPAPTAYTPTVTPAPAPAPAPVTDAPAPATVAPVTDAPTAAPAPVTTAPASGDYDDDDDDTGADATPSPAPVPVPAPVPTPAVTKKKVKHCT